MTAADVTLFRHSSPTWPGGPTVHLLDRREGFMLVAPSPCHTVLAGILAEQATIDPERLTRLDRAALIHRGYCQHCIDALRAKTDPEAAQTTAPAADTAALATFLPLPSPTAAQTAAATEALIRVLAYYADQPGEASQSG